MAKVLFLEDNPDMLQMFSEILELDGHTVITGKSGREGVALLEAHKDSPPQIIITDGSMPVMDGWAFLDWLRRNSPWTQLPCIIISGHVEEQQRARIMGANLFLLKPFQYKELERAITNLVGEM
ncbi:MAG: response regulator [Anaerolineae bacterium]|nr:response regulator [Anaerolineae bacterium]